MKIIVQIVSIALVGAFLLSACGPSKKAHVKQKSDALHNELNSEVDKMTK